MLPPYGACLLGSINLAALVERPFDDDAALDEAALAELTRTRGTAARRCDRHLTLPLPQQEAEAKSKRRIGLGVTGSRTRCFSAARLMVRHARSSSRDSGSRS